MQKDVTNEFSVDLRRDNYDWKIKCIDSEGNEDWHKSITDAGYTTINYCQQTLDGGYLLSGTTKNGEDVNYWIIGVDPEGNVPSP